MPKAEQIHSSEKEEEKFTVTVNVDNHTHEGEPVKKGGKIKVTKSEKAFMIKHKIIEG